MARPEDATLSRDPDRCRCREDVAVLFGIIGFLLLNPILVLIAFFIYIGASQEATYLRYNILLQDVTVADAMSSPVITVEPTMPLPG